MFGLLLVLVVMIKIDVFLVQALGLFRGKLCG